MYEKRLCILKQIKKGFSADGAPLTGAVYAERLGSELTITPRIAGLSPLSEGRYALAVRAGGKSYCLELKGNEPLRVPDSPSLERGFAALVCFVKGEAEPIAFGCCGGAPNDFGELLDLFSAKSETESVKAGRKRPIPAPMPPNQIPGAPSPQVPFAPGVPIPETPDGEDPPDSFREDSAPADCGKGAAPRSGRGANSPGYDDEAIASADYFLFDGNEDEDARCGSQTQENGQKTLADDKDGAVEPFKLSRGGLTYYNEIAPSLKAAFEKYPSDERLKAVFPNSEWVRAEGALLGIIYDEGLPRYLCVAMETEPPKEVKAYSVFVPLSPYSDEEGLNVVFQDADTGEYVRAEEA